MIRGNRSWVKFSVSQYQSCELLCLICVIYNRISLIWKMKWSLGPLSYNYSSLLTQCQFLSSVASVSCQSTNIPWLLLSVVTWLCSPPQHILKALSIKFHFISSHLLHTHSRKSVMWLSYWEHSCLSHQGHLYCQSLWSLPFGQLFHTFSRIGDNWLFCFSWLCFFA